MSSYTRGEFLGIGGALAGAFGLGGWPRADRSVPEQTRPAPGTAADLILVDGRVYTVDGSSPGAEAFAVKDGYFIAVGSNDDIRNLADADTEVVDAAGRSVTPGFIDCHCHPTGVRELLSANLTKARTIQEIQRILAEKAADTPPGHWVEGYGYDDTKVVDATTGRYRRITRWDLDEAVPDHPVEVPH
ncbi:MAG: amidohydrolase family protein, partial [Gemmatimonadetes bacterium]|nr:amidohydrolase family protein [Gemmatimonadota bacterium]NIT86522.1 amidohydrolase family protein [Gemmatimonadota bacterium]NIU30382.1 amidohydrolase family protein [Gemmatimonadota bacterium]NIU35260.1 amidohydrolase family protein [Gemmatimonadota bacterium]NIV60775.1 amidohydrolase family protein [Gemmatimonadota bacterium]